MPEAATQLICRRCNSITPTERATRNSVCARCAGLAALARHQDTATARADRKATCGHCGQTVPANEASAGRSKRPVLCATCIGMRAIRANDNRPRRT